MNEYLTVLFFSLIGGLLSLLGGLLLTRRNFGENIYILYLTPFAAGALLAAVFLDLLPEGTEKGEAETVLMAALAGILIFFIAERFFRWFHHHHADDEKSNDPSISLIIIGDTVHNALDGVVIAAAFLVSIPTGIVTTFAVAAHEIPQELGDFGLLLGKGMNRHKVIMVNIFSSAATALAAILTFSLGSQEKLPLGGLLGLSAGFLLYIALSDIIPTIHERIDASKLIQKQTLLLIAGVVTVGAAIQLAHGYKEFEHVNSPSTHEKSEAHDTYAERSH